MGPPGPGGPGPGGPPGAVPPPVYAPGPQGPPGTPPGPVAGPPPDDSGVPKDVAPPKLYVDPAKRYRQIGTIRLLSIIFTIFTGVLSIMANLLGGSGGDVSSTGFVAGSGLIVVGIVMGVLAVIWKETDEAMGKLLNPVSLFYFLSVFFIVIGGAIRANQLVVGSLYGGANVIQLGLAVLYGVMFLLYIEYMTAVRRFGQVGRMAIERNLKDFDFGHVISHYMGKGFLLLGIIVLITLVVLGFHITMIQYLASPQFADSVELQSVYGVVVAEAVIFSLIAVAVAFAFSGQTGKEEIASVGAFSQTQMDQIASNAQQQAPTGPGAPGPAPVGAPGPGGPPPAGAGPR